MVGDRFSALLEELSSAMQIKLAPDAFNSCLITFPDKMTILLKPSSDLESLSILSEIASPGQGSYRLLLFKEALKANAQKEPKDGVFCYGEQTNKLLLYKNISMADLTGPMLFDTIQELVNTARLWKESIEHNEIPRLTQTVRHDNPFGLR